MIDIEVAPEAVACPHAVQPGVAFAQAPAQPADEPRVVPGLTFWARAFQIGLSGAVAQDVAGFHRYYSPAFGGKPVDVAAGTGVVGEAGFGGEACKGPGCRRILDVWNNPTVRKRH